MSLTLSVEFGLFVDDPRMDGYMDAAMEGDEDILSEEDGNTSRLFLTHVILQGSCHV